MRETIDRPARQGLVRRFLDRGKVARTAREKDRQDQAQPSIDPPKVIDLRDDLPATRWRMAVAERLERLEAGMALVAATMKQAFSQLYASMEDLQAGRAGPPEAFERILAESAGSLKVAVEDLSESIHRVPYVLAAAADDITARLDAATSGAGADAVTARTGPGTQTAPSNGGSETSPESFPATPFELEPIEEQFAAMDEDDERLEAQAV